ncbi:hypothetical protein F4803DRAFT_572341 [Xylaria telfairii]|nr:hypothetical protein F4803DRAFT_572341 [Xylaria telfairii]
MDWDERVILDNNVSFLLWIREYDKAREERLTDWASSLHRDHLPCKLATHKLDDSRGAYNINCKVVFNNWEKWMILFQMVGKVMHADEKVEIEVAAMKLIRQKTNIPIPNIKAWGFAIENPLGIGPFIMMEFIELVKTDHREPWSRFHLLYMLQPGSFQPIKTGRFVQIHMFSTLGDS